MREYVRSIATAIAKELDADLLVLLVALMLMTCGLWPVVGRVALVVPGATLLWVALPSRRPFVHRVPDDSKPQGAR